MNDLVAFAAAGCAVLGADQATKHAVVRVVPAVGWGSDWLAIRPHTNARGNLIGTSVQAAAAAFGVLAAVAVALVGIGATIFTALTATALGLGLGGAGSNLFDRTRHHGVVDFVVIWRWPSFNVADVAIVACAVLVPGSLLL